MWAIESGESDPGQAASAIANLADYPTRPADGSFSVGQKVVDPFRDPTLWQKEGRGQQEVITLDATTGAHLNARLYWPNGPGPFPGVVFVPGLQAYNELYSWIGEGLAENGYMVLIPDPQGQGSSENLPHNPDGSINCSTAGCPNTPTNDFPEVTSGLDFLLSTPASPDRDAVGANAAGTLPYNPEWQLLDPTKVGVSGHSLGAIAVTSQGQNDPRVKAIVSLDNLDGSIKLNPGANIHTPTLYFQVDYPFPDPPTPQNPDSTPNPTEHLESTFAQTKAAGVDTMLIVPRASDHYAFQDNPIGSTALPQARYAQRVGFYYMLAWFDRYLKGELSADKRLTGTSFDKSADTSSIGQGTYDPTLAAADPTNPAAGNVPYTLGGDCVSNLLSFYYYSGYWLNHGTLQSTNMQGRGCP